MTDANTKPDFIARSACNWLTQLDVSTNYILTYMSGAYSRFFPVGGLNILPERQKFWGVSPPPLEQFERGAKTNLKQQMFSEN